MAIKRPETIAAHRLAAAARAEDGGRTTCLSREECDLKRQGKEVAGRRCGTEIEAKPFLGQIGPSEAALAKSPGQTRKNHDDRTSSEPENRRSKRVKTQRSSN